MSVMVDIACVAALCSAVALAVAYIYTAEKRR